MFGDQSFIFPHSHQIYSDTCHTVQSDFQRPGRRRRRSRSHFWVLALTASSWKLPSSDTIFFSSVFQRLSSPDLAQAGLYSGWGLMLMGMLTPPFLLLFDRHHFQAIHGHNLPMNVHGFRVLYPQEPDKSANLFRCPLLQLGRRFPTNAEPMQRFLHW